jgi:hypothetical protein
MAEVKRVSELTPSDSLYPLSNEAELLLVTPEMASDWLSTRHWQHQRNLSTAIVAKYIRDMSEGRWKVTRQGLAFDTEGHMIDGQHRLRAVANCDPATLQSAYGAPGVIFWVYPNEPGDTFDAYDQNYKRTAAHLIHEPYARVLAASARFMAAVEDRDPYSFPRLPRITTPKVLETKRKWPELGRHIGTTSVLGVITHLPVPEHTAMLAQASRTEHADKIPAWVEALRHGSELAANDPRLKVRERFMSSWVALAGSANRPRRYSQIVKAWNAYVKGEDMQVLVWRQAVEQIPMVEGFTPKEEN